VRKIIAVVSAAVLALTLAACGGSSGSSDPNAPLKVGASPVPHAEILDYIKKNLAPKAGLKLDVVSFNDYVQPNMQLQDGTLDANYFQTKPFLDDFTKSHPDVKFSWIEDVHLEPLGLYSKKVTDAKALANGATVALSNDPTNLGRGLKLLADNGLITLKSNKTVGITEKDVAANPKNLQFKPLDPAQLPRSLADVDAAVINGNFAIKAGLSPAKDSLLLEKAKNNPNANGLVVQTKDKNDPRVQKLAKLLRDPKVKQFIKQKYDGSVLPSF
jgi:D-methionine transport system substrate-binding protein